MPSINHNSASLVGLLALDRQQRAIATAMERIATGKRINHAKDDPAGISVVARLAKDQAEIETSIRGSEIAAHLVGSADAGLAVIEDMLADLNAGVVQAANTGGTTREELESLQVNATASLNAIALIIETSGFKGSRVLRDGYTITSLSGARTFGGLNFAGLGSITVPNADETGTEQYDLRDIATGKLNFVNGDTELAQKVIDAARKSVGALRQQYGSLLKYDLGAEIDALRVQLENTIDAKSKIEDADLPKEMSGLIRAQILQQAAIGAIGIASAQGKGVLQLLG